MKKTIVAFYDVVIYLLISAPLAFLSLFLFLTTHLANEEWYIVVLFAFGVAIPASTRFLIRYFQIDNNYIYFHHTNRQCFKKAYQNIDAKWNNEMYNLKLKMLR